MKANVKEAAAESLRVCHLRIGMNLRSSKVGVAKPRISAVQGASESLGNPLKPERSDKSKEVGERRVSLYAYLLACLY